MAHNYFRPFRSEVIIEGETASPAGGGVSPFLRFGLCIDWWGGDEKILVSVNFLGC